MSAAAGSPEGANANHRGRLQTRWCSSGFPSGLFDMGCRLVAVRARPKAGGRRGRRLEAEEKSRTIRFGSKPSCSSGSGATLVTHEERPSPRWPKAVKNSVTGAFAQAMGMHSKASIQQAKLQRTKWTAQGFGS